MTNKINGIDVSECKNFSCGICEEENKIPRTIGHFTADCTFYPNCYFKQLKRLQEKNKELKNKNNDLIEEIASVNIDITILQKENEKLKADLKGETEQCQKWYQLETDKHFQMLKYEQALEKIRKEYTNSIFYQCDKTEEECPCHNCIILGQLDRVQNIVKIIDELKRDSKI